ncbi:hypothetical protein HPP92_016173 [Vanilla planifolia]|uniref:Uncharacterized protein n=1 Tax=Vanilla planifolia TaxID=51239 RepID=A0A835QIT2_VANPL|nr:hypothetical protein HPP92_016173 [Vanilla planifolia]
MRSPIAAAADHLTNAMAPSQSAMLSEASFYATMANLLLEVVRNAHHHARWKAGARNTWWLIQKLKKKCNISKYYQVNFRFGVEIESFR